MVFPIMGRLIVAVEVVVALGKVGSRGDFRTRGWDDEEVVVVSAL